MIKINNVAGFSYALKSLKTSINSVVFDTKGDVLAVNVKSSDNSQICNLKWNPKTIETRNDGKKIGIFNLGEFLNILDMFEDKGVTCEVNENKMVIKYRANENAEVKYNLTDTALIQEGPEGPKAKLEYLVSLKLDKDFLKKVKNISSSIGVNILSFECINGVISYQIADKYYHSNSFRESLVSDSSAQDFTVSLNIEKMGIIPDGKEVVINIHEKAVEFVLTDPEVFDLIRYFIAPIITT